MAKYYCKKDSFIVIELVNNMMSSVFLTFLVRSFFCYHPNVNQANPNHVISAFNIKLPIRDRFIQGLTRELEKHQLSILPSFFIAKQSK